MPDTILDTVQARRQAAIHEQQDKLVAQGVVNRGRGGGYNGRGRGGGYNGRGRGGRGGGRRQDGFVPRENYNNPDHWT